MEKYANMKDEILNKWINPAALTNKQTSIMANNSNISIIELKGKNIFATEKPKGIYAISLLITEGEISFVIKNEKTTIIAPAYIEFIFITEIYGIKTSDNFKGILIYIDEFFFKMATENIRFTLSKVIYYYSKKPFIILNQEEENRIMKYINSLSETINQNNNIFTLDVSKNILKALLYEIWNIVIQTFNSNKKKNNIGYIEDDIIGNFIYLVNTHCREQHQVKWYTEQLIISPDALSARLRKIYGKTANQLIDEVLATDAKICLLDKHNSVQDVAEMLNFSDQASFCKFFKRCTGLSPREFKKIDVLLE